MSRRLLVPLCVGILGTALPSHADPVLLVTSGSYSVRSGGNGDWQLSAGGFSFEGMGLGSVLPFWACLACPPGTDVSLSAELGPGDFGNPGRATVGQQAYEAVWWSGSMRFDAGSVAAQQGLEHAGPFSFDARLVAFSNESRTGPALFTAHLRGSGRATISFFDHLEFGGLEVRSIRYDFAADPAPVPEPATMMLFASGLAAAAALRRRRSPGPP